MGARLLHDSVLAPLTDAAAIDARLDAVEELLRRPQASRRAARPARSLLRHSAAHHAGLHRPGQPQGPRRHRPHAPPPAGREGQARRPPFGTAARRWKSGSNCARTFANCSTRPLTDDPPFVAKDGGVIRPGFNAELDELRNLTTEGKNWIARYQAQEITRTGIASLKVGVQPGPRLLHRGDARATRRRCRPTTSARGRSRTPSATSRPT